MASPYEIAAGRSSAAVDRAYGEAFRFIPMKPQADRNARFIPDPARAETDVVTAKVSAFARGLSGPAQTPGVQFERPGHSTTRDQFSIDRAALPYVPANGDYMRRISDSVLFRIAEIRRDDAARWIFDVNIIGG